ncbi:hypothetical protein BDV24DRAFT_170299 [Aspergillus arachidicola]|uniref:Uncharacterized protein n=1 Tax=Aspergillus arachidicola TaxID=656916 RepID=A0A5N6XM48_9EURO|nr:hypothetical protein BDV24DRAFT_170299 [Aspergillus arachidicola]
MLFNLGMPELQQLGGSRKNKGTEMPGTPGNPFGPMKKPERVYKRPGVIVNQSNVTNSKGRTDLLQKPRASRGVGVTSLTGTAVAFGVMAPYAHDIFDKLNGWDNPIGRELKWFDDVMAATH